jgi:mRNA interferase RelE/StbE
MVGKKFENMWRYRVGEYRVLVEIKEEVVTILVVEVGHRREIYR